MGYDYGMNTQTIYRAAQAAGNAHRLSKMLGISHVAVGKWIRRGRIPAERVLAVEKATGGKVSRYELRPDIYPREIDETLSH
jgi:DNA-binding transcriptional regulator YdaS (Cro superfamily)